MKETIIAFYMLLLYNYEAPTCTKINGIYNYIFQHITTFAKKQYVMCTYLTLLLAFYLYNNL